MSVHDDKVNRFSKQSTTMVSIAQLESKINEIIAELKKTDLWTDTFPSWVYDYAAGKETGQPEFSDWLQFILLPNLMLRGEWPIGQNVIAPQAVRYLGNDVRKGKLLQLLIELDSLT